jgi:hypothetical protein
VARGELVFRTPEWELQLEAVLAALLPAAAWGRFIASLYVVWWHYNNGALWDVPQALLLLPIAWLCVRERRGIRVRRREAHQLAGELLEPHGIALRCTTHTVPNTRAAPATWGPVRMLRLSFYRREHAALHSSTVVGSEAECRWSTGDWNRLHSASPRRNKKEDMEMHQHVVVAHATRTTWSTRSRWRSRAEPAKRPTPFRCVHQAAPELTDAPSCTCPSASHTWLTRPRGK